VFLKFHSSNLPTKYLSLTTQNPKAAVDFDPELPYVNFVFNCGEGKTKSNTKLKIISF
jgi:hypothetical protein